MSVLLGSVLLGLASLALADAERDYKALFGPEEAKVAASRNTKDAPDFAAKLLNAAKSLGEQKDLQALLLEKAYEFGLKSASGQQIAIEAMKSLMEVAPDKKAQARAREKLLKVYQTRYARSAGDERKRVGQELLDLLVTCGDEQAAAKEPAEALTLYRQALSIATTDKSERLREIMDKIKAISSVQESARKLTALKARVEKDPKDTAARTELILLYLGEFDNPVEAAKLVAPDLDERVRTYLPLSPKPVEELDEAVCLELAQWYADLAEKASAAGKGILLGRAKECCDRFLALHTAQDVTRLKGKMLLDKVAKGAAEVAARPAAGLPKMITLDLGKGVTMKLALIPAGKFMMGSMQAEQLKAREQWRRILKSHDSGDSLSKLFANEGPQHEVTISKPFYMGVCEVTQEQYQAVMGTDPSKFKGAKNPVEDVTWTEAVEFCRTLSEKTGKTVRLPTQAQWEYACRAGTKTKFSFGDDDAGLCRHGNYADRTCTESDNVARNDMNHSDGHAGTSPAGSYKPNPWGLYDMHGNVWEWCADWDSESYQSAEDRDPAGPDSGTKRVVRGGGWLCSPQYCRSAVRISFPPDTRASGIGFRVVVEAGGQKATSSAPEKADPAEGQKLAGVENLSGREDLKEFATLGRMVLGLAQKIGGPKTQLDLVGCYDASGMDTQNAKLAKVPGSYAEQVRSGAVDGTFLYGPYKEFDAGKYIVVWRAASLEGSKGKSVGYGLLNIAQSKGGKLKSINGGPIGAMDFDAKTFSSPGWRYVPLPFELTCNDKETLEFPVFGRGSPLAVDRIYLYRLRQGE